MSDIPNHLRRHYRVVRSFCGTCLCRSWHVFSKKSPTEGSCDRCGRKKSVQRKKHREPDLHQASTKLYYVWNAMLHRCRNPANKSYHRYGGRGIKVCRRWELSFLAFRADMGTPAKGMSLERKNNDGPYAPRNCTWIPKSKQNANMHRYFRFITFKGVTKSLSEWAKYLGRSVSGLHARLYRLPVAEALTPKHPPRLAGRPLNRPPPSTSSVE